MAHLEASRKEVVLRAARRRGLMAQVCMYDKLPRVCRSIHGGAYLGIWLLLFVPVFASSQSLASAYGIVVVEGYALDAERAALIVIGLGYWDAVCLFHVGVCADRGWTAKVVLILGVCKGLPLNLFQARFLSSSCRRKTKCASQNACCFRAISCCKIA